jgi:steroid 5-alpha reductase family enzyme
MRAVRSALILASPAWIAAFGVMLLGWMWQRRSKNAAIVDVAWTALVGGLAIFYAVRFANGLLARRLAVAAMFGSWGARLAIMLLHDRVLGRPEEGRYAELRRRKGAGSDRWFFWFFQAQGLAAIVFAMPALLAVLNPALAFTPLEFTAVALWIVGFTGESTADRQLLYFKLNPENAGRTCRMGLWRYSRHPNYFFEWLMWVAYALFAAAAPHGWMAFACPAILLFLLLRVTGIPPTEAQALRTREDYREYQRVTSAFLPWFPRRSESIAPDPT